MFLNSEKVVIGYDLSDEYAQISYGYPGKTEPETLSLVAGEEQYNIPVCLFKRTEVNQWFFGKEARNYALVEEGTIFENLLELATTGEEVVAGEEKFDPIALLALFVKRSLSLMNKELKKVKPDVIMFTVPVLTPRVVEVLEQMTLLLDMSETKVFFQGREESIYHYVIKQSQPLWKEDVIVYDFSDDKLRSFRFLRNQKTTPVVTFVECEEHAVRKNDDDLDMRFQEVAKETLRLKKVSSVYLIGEGFNGNWCRESIRELCMGRRVFRGNNLFSKGACYAAMEHGNKSPDKGMIFLGKDKLKANVGMQVARGWEESYLALLNGGESWYESKKECQIILTEENAFSIIITPLDGRNVKTIEIVLDGLPQRSAKMTRLKIKVFMVKEDCMQINVTDMGFGDYEKSSGLNFEQQISLS